uniref:glucuronosyltransferase n=1 Tax=Caenorhabditis tropicalis TaxID=1561998 RepID=A0A1I7U6R9_9PELO
MNKSVFLNILLAFSSTSAFNYLVVSPGFGHSHSTFMGKVSDALSDAGHNVTTEELDALSDLMESGDLSRYWIEEGSMLETIPSYQNFIGIFDKVYANLRTKTHVLDEIKRTRPKYDAIIFESFMYMAKAIQEYLDIPIFLPVTSVTHDNRLAELFGEPCSPSYLSGYFTNYGNIMTFHERMTNTISYFLGKIILKYPNWKTLHDPTKPLEVESVYHRAPYVFTNSNPYIDFPRPMLAKTIQVGGLTVDVKKLKSEKVDEKWNTILNERPHNVLISFGTLFKAVYMPDTYKSNFVKVMKSFKNVTFIWKYESNETGFGKEAKNVVFSKWIPQTALLADSRLSAFLTHGGLGSVNELSYLGKPAILCPLFADQLRNAKMLARHNGSIQISKFDLADYNTLRSAIHRILFDKSITDNALNLAKRLENQPMKPKDLLVRHAEFAAQFGEQPGLDSGIRNMTFVQYYLLDVIAVFAVIALSVIFGVYYVVRKVLFLLLKKQKED